MLDDLFRHPGFTYLAFSAFVIAGLWMWYTYRMHQEEIELEYAQLALQAQILEELRNGT